FLRRQRREDRHVGERALPAGELLLLLERAPAAVLRVQQHGLRRRGERDPLSLQGGRDPPPDGGVDLRQPSQIRQPVAYRQSLLPPPDGGQETVRRGVPRHAGQRARTERRLHRTYDLAGRDVVVDLEVDPAPGPCLWPAVLPDDRETGGGEMGVRNHHGVAVTRDDRRLAPADVGDAALDLVETDL